MSPTVSCDARLVLAFAGDGVPVPEAGHEVDDGEYLSISRGPISGWRWPSRRRRPGRLAGTAWVDGGPAGDHGRARGAGRDGRPLMAVIMSKEFHRAIDVDGSLKGKAWDFLTKLSRDADLTGLDLKMPQNAADRRVRTARVDLNFRAVLFAVGRRGSRYGCSPRSSRTTTPIATPRR